jgi:predicted RNA-binding Zn-ribbon protein involved in translation (DUF1610 family)
MSSMRKVHKVKAVECPVCGTELNSARCVDGNEKPKEYDLSVCGFCTAVMVFNKDLRARVITDAEFEILKSVNPGLYNQLNDTIKVIENRKGRPVGLFDTY